MSAEISPPPMVVDSTGMDASQVEVKPTPMDPAERKSLVASYKKSVRLPPPLPDVAFPIRLKLPTGESVLISCENDTKSADLITRAMAKSKSLGEDPSIYVVTTSDNKILPDPFVVVDNPSVKTAKSNSQIPILNIINRTSVTPEMELAQQPGANPPPRPIKPQILERFSKRPVPPPSLTAAPTLPNPREQASASESRAPSMIFQKAALLSSTIAKTAAFYNPTMRTIQQLQKFQVLFILPGGHNMLSTCPFDATVASLKAELKQKSPQSLPKPLNIYVLKTPLPDGFLSDDTQLSNIPYVESCRKESTTPKLIVVEQREAITKKGKRVNMEIGSLIGSPLCWTTDDSEITQFRKSMMWVRYKLHKEKSTTTTSAPAAVASEGGGKTMIRLRLPLIEASLEKAVIVGENETIDQFVEKMFVKYYEKKLPNLKPTDFTLKVPGLAEYVTGDILLVRHPLVIERVIHNQKVELVLVQKEVGASEDYMEEFPAEEFMEDPIIKYDFEELSSDSRPYDQMNCIPIWELTRNFRVKLVGAENFNTDLDLTSIYVDAGLYHGGILIASLMSSQPTSPNSSPRWYEYLTTNIQLANLPKETRICFTLWGKTSGDEEIPLGWVNCQLNDYKQELKTGLVPLCMWPNEKANPIGTCIANNNSNATVLFVEFDSYSLPVVFPTEPMKDILEIFNRKSVMVMSAKASKIFGVSSDNHSTIDKIIASDPLFQLTEQHKKILWEERDYCKSHPQSLPKFLLSVGFNDRFQVQVMHRLLLDWPLIGGVEALELLDSKFADAKVREYAVQCLEQLNDDSLLDYLLQLIQVLKYEPYHDSALARYLLRRALLNRRIGHSFFWYLKSEMHVPVISERYGLLLEAYLRGCGTHRLELQKQISTLKDFVRIANFIKTIKDEDRKKSLQAELRKVQFPTKLQLPLNPSMEVNGVVVEKCKYMDSKKLPLWIVLKNADANVEATKTVIFKSGDDLRQDMLTLQMIRLMDKFWKQEGLNLELSPYGCIATGSDEGMIEVVLAADTMANITKNAGGAKAALFREDPLANWIRGHNPKDDSYAKAVDNFILSCAGYCVATYVLGIGDRHNDNVMLKSDGRMFHIDFGHFLGNYKKKFGFKRERAPFVFTPDFAYVMGGRDSEGFNKFVDLCCRAYNILRKHASVFINLFAMMLSTGIPELTSTDDLIYLRDAFSLDMNNEQAREKFKDLIYESLNTRTTQFNNAIHILAH